MKEAKHYDKAFYTALEEGSYQSAKRILPIIHHVFKPASVVDIGCGSGHWLKVWKEDLHVEDLLGVEGTYVTDETFQLDKQQLLTADLKMPLQLNRRFDIATSMEVAEHIPADHADIFIKNLVDSSDIILFSAAIVGQLGTYHINEQMPEYWAKKFAVHDYVAVDYLRPKIWNDSGIQYWYRQNALLFLKRSRLTDFPELQKAVEATDPGFLLRIHPEKYFAYVQQANMLETIPGFLKYTIKKWLKR